MSRSNLVMRPAAFMVLSLCTLFGTGCDELGLRLGPGRLPTPKPLDQTPAAAVWTDGDDPIEQPLVPDNPVVVVPPNAQTTPVAPTPATEDDETPVPRVRSYSEWTYAETALDSLGRIGAPAVPPLIVALDDPDPLVRYRAAKVLARIGPDALEAVPALVRHLNDVDLAVRREAARALGQIGPQASEAVPYLIEALKTDEPT